MADQMSYSATPKISFKDLLKGQHLFKPCKKALHVTANFLVMYSRIIQTCDTTLFVWRIEIACHVYSLVETEGELGSTSYS